MSADLKKGRARVMNCCKSLLTILNLFFMMVSVGILSSGALLKYFAHITAGVILVATVAVDPLSYRTRTDFGIPDIGDLADLPLVGQAGVILMSVGSVLIGVCCLACLALCFQNRVKRYMLKSFVVLLCVMVLMECIMGGLFLTKGSLLHSSIEDSLSMQIKSDYTEGGKNEFTVSVTFLQYHLDCCGMRGPSDYANTTVLPATCCRKNIIDNGDNNQRQACRQHRAPPSDYNSEGCYDRIQDLVSSGLAIAAGVTVVLLLVQVMEIGIAIFIIRFDRQTYLTLEEPEAVTADSSQCAKDHQADIDRLSWPVRVIMIGRSRLNSLLLDKKKNTDLEPISPVARF